MATSYRIGATVAFYTSIFLLLGLSLAFHSTTLSPVALLSSRLCHTQRRTRSMARPRTRVKNSFWPEQHITSDNTSDNNEGDDDCSSSEDDFRCRALDSVVQVHCTHSEPDFLIPWQRQHQATSTSSGFVISIPGIGLRVMTNAHSVEYGSMVQVQRRGDEHKYQAKVHVIANECDLALLDVDVEEEDIDFWDGLEPLEFGPLPELQQEVEVWGYPTGGDSLSVTKGVVSRIEMQEYSQSSSHLLAIQIDAAINPGNSGGPVANEDLKIIGVAFQGLDGAENIGYVVPSTVVQHVLTALENGGGYRGFCSVGISTALLENKSFRKSLGMVDKKLSGVMVKSVHPAAASKGTLQPRDVILEVDGIPVANDGKIPFRPGERVRLACYTQTKFPGDTLKVRLLREGSELELDVPVSISKKLVPAHFDNRPPPYFVVSGLVFTALSVPYLYASSAWECYVSDSISYLLGKWLAPLERETDQVVILSQVLAHEANLGYDTFADLHLEKVNGVKVRSLNHLKEVVDSCQDEFLSFEFSPGKRLIVLERSAVDQVTSELCEEHSIPKSHCLYDSSSPVLNGSVKQSTTVETVNGGVSS